MTLLQDINKALEESNDPYFDAEAIAEVTNSEIDAENLFLGTTRWGHLNGTVFTRLVRPVPLNGPPRFEHVRVIEYVYSGDSDGDLELSADAVVPREVTTIEWDAL